MKNIKLKQTNLCFLISLLPILAPAALLFISLIIAGNAEDDSSWQYLPFIAIAADIAGIIAFFRRFGTAWFVLLSTIISIDAWKKDRRFYFTDVNGRTADEAVNAIQFRVKYYAKALETENRNKELLGAFKKRRHSFNEDTSGFEDYYVIYQSQSLTKDFCSNAVSESKSIMRKFAEKGIYPFLQTRKERKQPVTRSCALIIVCDSIGSFNAEEYVRKSFSKGHTGLAICIYEAATGRYFFNGSLLSSDSFLPEQSADVISAKLIKKAVFCKQLGLRENSYYMPTDDLPYNPEITLYEAFEDIKKDVKTSDLENKKIVKRLKNGDVYFDGDGIFYKKDGRTLLFSVMSEENQEDEEENGKKYVLTDKSWSYPKHSKMSKNDYDESLIKIAEYLNSCGIDFEFTDFEKWLEKN